VGWIDSEGETFRGEPALESAPVVVAEVRLTVDGGAMLVKVGLEGEGDLKPELLDSTEPGLVPCRD